MWGRQSRAVHEKTEAEAGRLTFWKCDSPQATLTALRQCNTMIDVMSHWPRVAARMAKKTHWNVLYDGEFDVWFSQQNADLQDSILKLAVLLTRLGPHLGRPRVDTIKGSDFDNMKELIVQHKGKPWRILFAFDPNQDAVFLIGGCKSGDDRWYTANMFQ